MAFKAGVRNAAFDARDIGLRGLHAPSQLRLRQARGRPGLDQRPREVELFTEGVVGCLVVGVLAPAAVELTDQRAIGAARLRRRQGWGTIRAHFVCHSISRP